MNRLKDAVLYLLGNIDSANDLGIGWRNDLKPFLKGMGVKIIDPCNKVPLKTYDIESEGKDFHKRKKELKSAGKYDELARLMKPIVRYDLAAVDRSDIIVAGLDLDSRPFGSVWELAYAHLLRKPIIICCKQSKAQLSDWAFGLLNHHLFFDTWSEVREYLSGIDKNETIDDLNGKLKIFNFDYE